MDTQKSVTSGYGHGGKCDLKIIHRVVFSTILERNLNWYIHVNCDIRRSDGCRRQQFAMMYRYDPDSLLFQTVIVDAQKVKTNREMDCGLRQDHVYEIWRHFGNFSVFEIFRHVTMGHEGRSLAMIYPYDPDSPLFQKTLSTARK